MIRKIQFCDDFMTTASTAAIHGKATQSLTFNLTVKCRSELFYDVYSVIFASEMADHFGAIAKLTDTIQSTSATPVAVKINDDNYGFRGSIGFPSEHSPRFECGTGKWPV